MTSEFYENSKITCSKEYSSQLESDLDSYTISPIVERVEIQKEKSYKIGTIGTTFEDMVDDMRQSMLRWLNRSKATLDHDIRIFHQEKQAFDRCREHTLKMMQSEKDAALREIHDERREMELEVEHHNSRLKKEREEFQLKMENERARYECIKKSQELKLSIRQENLEKRIQDYELERIRANDSIVQNECVVEINVGGALFETSRQTLLSQKGTLFEGLLTGRYFNEKEYADKRIFLDRDPGVFRKILNYLRNPSMRPQPHDEYESNIMSDDSEYYGIRYYSNNPVYVLGGHNDTDFTSSLEILNKNLNQWEPGKNLTEPRAYFGSGMWRNKLVIYGGQNSMYTALSTCSVYDNLRDCWYNGASLNNPRRDFGSCFNNDGLFFAIGGYDGILSMDNCEYLDIRQSYWVEMAPIPYPSSGCCCGMIDGQIYLLGGHQVGIDNKSIFRYDIKMNKWEQIGIVGQGTSSRLNASCVTYGSNYMYIIGGHKDNGELYTGIDLLHHNIIETQQQLFTPTSDAAAAICVDEIFYTGGINNKTSSYNRNPLRDTQIYNPNENIIVKGPPLRIPRFGHQSVVVKN